MGCRAYSLIAHIHMNEKDILNVFEEAVKSTNKTMVVSTDFIEQMRNVVKQENNAFNLKALFPSLKLKK